MAIHRRDQEALDQVFQEYGGEYGGRREDYFPLLYLTRKFKCDPREVAHQVAFGEHPCGLNAYYIDPAARNLYLYQFRWTEDHNACKPALERLARDGIDRIFAIPYSGSERNDILRYLRADLREYKALIERVYIRLVFKGDVDAADNSAGLAERRESLEDKKYLIDRYFGDRPVELTIEFVSDRPGRDVPPPRDSFTVPFAGDTALTLSSGQATMHLGFIRLMDLHCMYQALGQKFFDRNIRAGLDPENPPNRRLREALGDIVLRGHQSPEVFAFNHNGVTLSVAQVEVAEGQATLQVPRLLNGAQTCISLARFLEENEGSEVLAAHRDLLDAIRVLAKVIIAPDRDFVTQVTICNNQQNPVEPWNLRANDRIQCDLQDRLKEELGIYYSRQENAFQQMTQAELEELGIEEDRDVQMRPLAQTLLAVQGEIDRMSRLTEVFESARMYRETFRESVLHADPRKLVLAYKIGLLLNSPMERLAERVPGRLREPTGRARHLVWALLIQGALNDRNLPTLLDRFGASLSRETEFREYLKEMAERQIASILKQVLADDSYSERIGGGKYSFLRSREMFKRSMEAARHELGWTKKSL